VAVVLAMGCAPAAEPDGRPGTPAAGGLAAPPTGQTAAPERERGAHEAHPAASQVVPERPLQVALPSGTTLPVDVSVTDPGGTLSLPHDVDRAGWWRDGARLGQPFGAVVLAAHVDSFAEGIGPIAELLSAEPGDALRLWSRTLTQRYVVVSVRLVPRADLPGLAPVMSFAGGARLVVITCGGPYDAARGGYQDNLVVVAEPRGGLTRR